MFGAYELSVNDSILSGLGLVPSQCLIWNHFFFCFNSERTSSLQRKVVSKWHSVFAGLQSGDCLYQGLGAGLL